jgi:Xaa-Pro aminopeptidase
MSLISIPTSHPVLTTAERDRRYAALRALMRSSDLRAIVFFPGGPERLERYASNEVLNGVVVLPSDADPIYLIGRHPLPRYDVVGADFERWIDDIRLKPGAEGLADVLVEVGGIDARVGVVGLSSRSVGAGAGYIPFSLWASVEAAAPAIAFVDVSVAVEHIVLVKSEEELTLMRTSAALGEAACEAFIGASRDGGRESEAVAAAFAAMVAGGGEVFGPGIIQRSGSDRFGWAPPEWLTMGGGSRVLQRGDTISAEIFAYYAGYQTQQQIDVAIGAPNALLRDLEAVCIESYDIGVSMIRPGVMFGEIAAAMERPIIDAGFWNTGPQIQTVSPVMYNSATHQNTHVDPRLRGLPSMPPTVPQDGDFVLEKGIVFAVQPNALLGGRRVSIGGAVITTESAAEQLNSLPLVLNVVES